MMPPAQPDEVRPLAPAEEAITAPGRYVLQEDRTGPLRILADRVVLDLRGHQIAGPGDRSTREVGIYIAHGLERVTIANGRISGFMYGVLADDGVTPKRSSRIALRRLTLSGHTFRGALLFATDASVDRCVVGPIGGTTVHEDAYVMGIELRGDRSRARHNTVYEVYGNEPGESVGICLSDEGMDQCVVEGNTVVNARVPAEGRSFGVWARNRAAIRGNTLVNLTYAIAPPEYRAAGNTVDNVVIGEQCSDGLFASAGRGLRTVLVPMAVGECVDRVDLALARMRPDDARSIVRVASLYEAMGDKRRALEHYRRAAELGSAEAARWVRKLER